VQVCSGAAIEDTLGASLGLSTLAAAGLGNAASDGIGIGMSHETLFQLVLNEIQLISLF
jgi:Transmembrane protein 65